MNIFPEINIPKAATEAAKTVTYGRELDFDFEKGEFVIEDGAPKVLEGVEALRVWIEKAIRTARYRFPVYSFSYGCELEDIIGLDLPQVVLESEIPRIIKEALIYDDRISDVSDFKIERDKDYLVVEFTVTTFDGQTLPITSREAITSV